MIITMFLKSAFRILHGPTPEIAPGGPDSGYVLMADGVGGLDLCATGLKHVAAKTGFPHEIKVVSWGHGVGRWHRDLTNVENHRRRSAELADEVLEHRRDRPGVPVFLVGKSGGTGIVVRTLELLPPDSVERAILISSAISPDYDLSRALTAVRREMVLFWSPLDLVILGAGTRIFGTVDRIRKVSAGLVGFRRPSDLDEAGRAQYGKLRQVRWSPGMVATGHFGGHIGPDNPAFLEKYVLPLLSVTPEPPESGARESRSPSPASIT